MSRGVFVTGTDTGVGKTVVACALVHALRARGYRVAPMKPVAAGAISREGVWANEDTLALAQAAGPDAPAHHAITPVLLREAMAPHIAASREGLRIDLAALVEAHRQLALRADFTVVEGVGGFRVPLGPSLDARDLASALQLPVVLVVGLRLGCLNHALLTAESIERAGLALAGWIANAIDPAMRAQDENVDALAERLRAPLLGRLPFAPDHAPATRAGFLDVKPLVDTRG
ncbi:MAG TPA: dethiobiotin synthase [Usitatibacteraceae bacterium]|nr:dethiobiotin synthase [Usitatibacteraceae bacterium]